MLLAVDIGNTNTVIGGFLNEELVFEFRLNSDLNRTVDEYHVLLVVLLQEALSQKQSVRGAVISSVVPPLTPIFETVIKRKFNVDPLEIGPGIKTGIALKVSDPSQVGADRVVNGLAVRELYGPNSLVVDFGTATTFDYVNPKGEYDGGVIAPGLYTSVESLVRNTAKLPRIDLIWPNKIIGKNTVSAMQSGAMVGYVCLVEGIIDRISNEVGGVSHVVATGGLGEVIAKHTKKITKYDPTLTLKGMRMIAKLNDL